jgi:predicted transcriptional regulator
MGWSHAGNTRQKYQHYYSDDGIDAMLLADGLPVATANGKGATKNKNLLKPKPCPNCNENNKPDSKFCVQCKFVLSFNAFNEVTNEAEETKKKLVQLEVQQQEQFKQMQEKMDNLRRLALKQAFRVIENEVESNPVPYIEGAENMTTQEALYELQKKGVTTWEG